MSETILELGKGIPTELVLRILKLGAVDEAYGTSFSAKCLLLARRLHREMAPLLYSRVIIRDKADARSFLLAITYDHFRKEYKVSDLVHSLIFRDQPVPPTEPVYVNMVARITRSLNMQLWQELVVPLPVLAAHEAKGLKYDKLPPFITFTGSATLFSNVNYLRVTRIRIVDRDSPLWELKALFAIAKQLTHLAIKISSNPWQGMSTVHQIAAIARLECLIVAVDVPPGTEYKEELLSLKTAPMSHLPATDLSKTAILRWDDDLRELYHSLDAHLFWKKAEGMLT